MNELVANQIRLELGKVREQIRKMQRVEKALVEAVDAMQSLEPQAGQVIDRSRDTRVSSTISANGSAKLDGELYQPQPVEGPAVNRREQPNTLEMTRMVLRNAGGQEKTADDLRKMIRDTYGIEPAKSLDQMLYKRSAAGRGFYKTEDGRFGLTELRKGVTIEPVDMPTTVVV